MRSRAGVARLALIPGLAVSILWGGCRPTADPAPEIGLAWSLAPDPEAAGAMRLALTVLDTTTGRPIHGARVKAEANMSHPGMVPVLATAREVEPGHYEAPLALTMDGDWFVLVQVRLRDGRTVSRQVDLPGLRAGQLRTSAQASAQAGPRASQ